MHAYFIRFQLADVEEKDTEILDSLAGGASTTSAPVSILTGADERRSCVGGVGGNLGGSSWRRCEVEFTQIGFSA